MGMAWRRTVAGLMILAGLLTLGYVGISSYIAEQLVYEAPKAIVKTPASQSLRFANVSFPSRNDGIGLKGWLIPGVLPDGRLTVDRVIVVVHGTRTNRESPGDHLLELTGELARHGFGVLSFDMRGMGDHRRLRFRWEPWNSATSSVPWTSCIMARLRFQNF